MATFFSHRYKVITFLAVVSSQLHSSNLPTSCWPLFFVNSATIFSFGCHPLDGVRRGPPRTSLVTPVTRPLKMMFISLFQRDRYNDCLACVACVEYSSAVGAGFYGNEEANKGLQHFIDSAMDVRETINRTQSQVRHAVLHAFHALSKRCNIYTKHQQRRAVAS